MKAHYGTLSLIALMPWALNIQVVAQQVLYLKQNDQFKPVVAMAATDPQIAEDGKVTTVQQSRSGFTYALGKAKTYAPSFITVRGLGIVAQGRQLDPHGVPEDRALLITGDFTSAQTLNDVFLAIEVKSEAAAGNTLIAHEVGGLKAGSPVSVHFSVPFAADWGACQWTLHLFAGGPEVLHSAMPPAQVEHELDVMVQKKIEGVKNAPLQPLICPPPEYPAATIGPNVEGSATIAFGISPTGAVLDPVVKEASRPEFGEAALKAVRQWRFLPRIKDGQAVASKVELPLLFNPPPAEAKP